MAGAIIQGRQLFECISTKKGENAREGWVGMASIIQGKINGK